MESPEKFLNKTYYVATKMACEASFKLSAIEIYIHTRIDAYFSHTQSIHT